MTGKGISKGNIRRSGSLPQSRPFDRDKAQCRKPLSPKGEEARLNGLNEGGTRVRRKGIGGKRTRSITSTGDKGIRAPARKLITLTCSRLRAYGNYCLHQKEKKKKQEKKKRKKKEETKKQTHSTRTNTTKTQPTPTPTNPPLLNKQEQNNSPTPTHDTQNRTHQTPNRTPSPPNKQSSNHRNSCCCILLQADGQAGLYPWGWGGGGGVGGGGGWGGLWVGGGGCWPSEGVLVRDGNSRRLAVCINT